MGFRESDPWKELLQIDLKSRGYHISSESEAESSSLGIEEAVEWIQENPEFIERVVKLSIGEIPDAYHHYSYSPILIEALGKANQAEAVEPIKKKLDECKNEIRLYSKDLLGALMEIKDNQAVQAVKELVKKPFWRSKNYLVNEFLRIMREEPNPVYLDTLLEVVRNYGTRYSIDLIISELTEAGKISFEVLLDDDSHHVRCVAIEALKISNEKFITEDVLDELVNIAFNDKEEFVCRSSASDILQVNGRDVPEEFKRQPFTNITDSVRRVVEGTIFPARRPDDWAMIEIARIKYEGDSARVEIRSFWRRKLHITIGIWRECLWEFFDMGANIEISGDSCKISGICRAQGYETRELNLEYVISNLDRIAIEIAEDIAKQEGESRKEYIEFLNRAIANGMRISYPVRRFFKEDRKKIEEQGGCPPPN